MHPTYEFLIGPSIADLPRQLPLAIHILQLYSHFDRSTSEIKRIGTIVGKIEACYRYAGIPTRHGEAIRIKIKRLVGKFKDLLSKRKVSSNQQRMQEIQFAHSIRSLFEVTANENILHHRQIELLRDQRTHRKWYIELNHVNVPEYRQPIESQENIEDHLDDITEISDDISEISSEMDQYDEITDDPEYIPSSESDEELLANRKAEIPLGLLQRVHKTTASYRTCENLIDIGIELAGGSSSAYSRSKSTIWRNMTQYRSKDRKIILQNLSTSNSKIILQFDCKRFRRINERHLGNEDRIVIISHSEFDDVPLGVFPISSHSAENCANAIVNQLDKYNLRGRLIGLACDTEAVNTGRISGVCTSIESKLETDLLHLMCRHHIYEVVMKSVFENLFGRSTGPSAISIFKPLQENWDEIKRNGFVYEAMNDDYTYCSEIFQRLVVEAKSDLQVHALNKNIRDDYAEITDLSLKYLGIPTRSSFKVPGALNNARYMNKAIYSLKIYLFRNQLSLDPETEEKMRRFCQFIAITYTKFWNQCSVVTDAPNNDLKFLKELDIYKEFDRETALAGLIALKRHLWYLSDELVPLALFSDKVSNDEKDNIGLLLIPGAPSPRRACNSIRHQDALNDIQNLSLFNFISSRSSFLLNRLNIDTSFLQETADNWHRMKAYNNAVKKINHLIIPVNDGAERLLRRSELLINDQKVRSEKRFQDAIVSIGTRAM